MAWRDFYDFIAAKLEAARKFIDVEADDEDAAGNAAREVARQIEQSRAERFLQKVAQAIDRILQEEIIRTPSGKAFVPEKYVVFLNPDDARDWTGRKLDFVRHELSNIIFDEARKHAEDFELVTNRVEIDFRIDGTLEKNLLRVQAVLDENKELTVVADGEKTFVLGLSQTAREETPDLQTTFAEPLYTVEIWRGGELQNAISIHKREIVIGRGTAGAPPDVNLRDAAVSRRHAVIESDDDRNIYITHTGANPTFLNGAPLPAKQKTVFPPDARIEIGDFLIQIKNQ
jgi:hypothetical protein